MVIITLITIGVTAVVTGIASYFTFRSTEKTETAITTIDTAAIKNDVNIQEQPDVLGIFTIFLLTILVICRGIEMISVAVGSYQRSMKKKYAKRQLLPVIASTQVPMMQHMQQMSNATTASTAPAAKNV